MLVKHRPKKKRKPPVKRLKRHKKAGPSRLRKLKVIPVSGGIGGSGAAPEPIKKELLAGFSMRGLWLLFRDVLIFLAVLGLVGLGLHLTNPKPQPAVPVELRAPAEESTTFHKWRPQPTKPLELPSRR